MEFSQKQILEICFSRKIFPSKTNFAVFSNEVEEIVLRKSGFDRGTISVDSAKNISSAALNFTKRSNRVWEKYYHHQGRLFQHEVEPGKFLDQTFTVKIEAASPPIPRRTPPPKPSTSGSSKSAPVKRSARKAFEDKSGTAQRRESAEVRANYPPGAIRLAAAQTFRLDGDWDSAACLKEFVIVPGSSKKARASFGIENPGKLNLKKKKNMYLYTVSTSIRRRRPIKSRVFGWWLIEI